MTVEPEKPGKTKKKTQTFLDAPLEVGISGL